MLSSVYLLFADLLCVQSLNSTLVFALSLHVFVEVLTSKHVSLSCVRRESNADRCFYRKCDKYEFCVNGLGSVLRYTAKMLFLLRLFVLFSAKISKKILNQEGFSRQVKTIVLFSEKSSQN